ncbi:ABC transporter permease [Haliscomenobacter hydrossis]|uniref:FtsX-like permease family protein n=1 Tax=Haliscomenobacter hydrossis (strain ATCC 27775 / DSM 1100 / LMG 10767 / O) TaxID=760192 RepID=F4KZW5_HALH1|nr:ABC transporter permease [Haliscomenobacter hydrossis]AEE51535.1 protein of unknown function DUF214 [Haliscomenobacter hydrossis DSM 1100]
MLKNYFKIAWRSLLRNRTYTLLNAVGLTVGIVCALMLYTVIQFERSYDTHHQKKDRIYRLVTDMETPEGPNLTGAIPYPVPATLKAEYPQIENVSFYIGGGPGQITVEKSNQKFREASGIYAVEPSFFDIFDYLWLSNEASVSLGKPGNAVLTQAVAERYFGSWQKALGQTIRLNNNNILNVTGVIKNPPANSDLPITVLYSVTPRTSTDWVSINSAWQAFVLLSPNASGEQFNAMMPAFAKKHRPVDAHKAVFRLQPLSEMHFDARYGTPSGRTFSMATIRSLTLVGIFLLLMACINFINLATVQAIRRSKEVGVRKVVGGNRRQLLGQFLAETTLIVSISVLAAVALAQALMPLASRLLEFSETLQLLHDWDMLVFILALTLVVTFLSGFYPAIILSGFNPIVALKSQVKSTGNVTLRRALVVFQFAIAQVLVFGMLVVVKQMNYFQTKNLGFSHKDPVILLSVPTDSVSQSKVSTLKNELLQQRGISALSMSFNSPADDRNWFTPLRYDNAEKDTDFAANMKLADPHYFNLYAIEFVAGRAYAATDTFRAFVVNETLLKRLGIKDPQEAIGKTINLWDGYYEAPIVGVVKDFHAESLEEEISPMLMMHSDSYGFANVKIEASQLLEAMPRIEKAWNRIYPEYIFDYQFLDDKIASFYQQERQMSQLFKLAALIAIIIGCLGLFGLASFTAEQRVKEIGIRKVLGATTSSIVAMLSKDFLRLVLVAAIIAFPVGWYLMNIWLEDFAYRIKISWWMFGLVGVSALGIALFTVSFQAIRAAISNPLESIKGE